ncbi:MAG: ROK family protein [Saprospiraceae bacterium]
MQTKNILGVDVGGSNIKGAIVDLTKGELITERIKIETPSPSTPKAVAKVFVELVHQLKYRGKIIGCGFPSIIKDGVCYSAANIDKKWKGTDVAALFSKASGKKVYVTNDADAAGISEMQYGVGKGVKGSVLLITIGTGLGTALFSDGKLVENTEFGHLPFKGDIAEKYVSKSAMRDSNLTWDQFGKRFNEYLHVVERLVSPNLIILGGGISKKMEFFEKHIDLDTKVVPAEMFNHAGIIGAALFGYQHVAKLKS